MTKIWGNRRCMPLRLLLQLLTLDQSQEERNECLPLFWILVLELLHIPLVMGHCAWPDVADCAKSKHHARHCALHGDCEARPLDDLGAEVGPRHIPEEAALGYLVASLPRLAQVPQDVVGLQIQIEACSPYGEAQDCARRQGGHQQEPGEGPAL